MIPFFMKYKFVCLLLILSGYTIAQDHFISNSKGLPVFPLKKVKCYGLADTINALSEEYYFYDNIKQISKAITITAKGDSSIKEFVFNDKNRIIKINCYQLVKHEKENEFEIEFSYNNKGLLSYEEFKNKPGMDSYAFKYNEKGQLIEQKIYKKNDTQKITFDYDSLGQLKRSWNGLSNIEYVYWQGLLIKEMYLDKFNLSEFEILYSYENGLVTIIDRLTQIQKNIYLNGKLYKQKIIVDQAQMLPACGNDSFTDPSSLKVYEYYE